MTDITKGKKEMKMAEYEGIEDGIKEFRDRLPGWWFTLGVCSVSCDVTIGPDIDYLPLHILNTFDDGISVDLSQPAKLVDALRMATDWAVTALKEQEGK